MHHFQKSNEFPASQKMAMNVDFTAVGNQFSQYYYQLFSTDRNQLTTLYSDQSCLSFENDSLMGKTAIVQKLAALPFQKVRHTITKCNPQPVFDIDNGKAVFVSIIGKIFTDDDPEKGFAQTFLLRPNDEAGSSYYIANESFRLLLLD